jgi:lysophospholipase L1-like esterase
MPVLNSGNFRLLFPASAALAGLLAGSGCAHGPSPTSPAPATMTSASAPLTLPANDPRFRYEGRFDLGSSAGPVVIWQGSRLALDFSGDALALNFADAKGQNFFDAELDGRRTVIGVPEGAAAALPLVVPVSDDGRHHLTLFKRSEAAAGTVRFAGVNLAANDEAWNPQAPAYKLRMQFIGDSITVGACNEDGATDQWEDRRTHNHALSYATLTSLAFQADHRAIAVSGMGVVIGYVEPKAGQIWDRVYPEASSPRADLAAWQPDVVLVNFGENDDSYSRSQNLAFPSADFTRGYVALVGAIRAAYPHAQIVLLRGGMYGGKNGPELRTAWEAVVQETEARDAAVSHFVFQHWSGNHPRVADDRAMADELIAWLKAQPFFARYLR